MSKIQLPPAIKRMLEEQLAAARELQDQIAEMEAADLIPPEHGALNQANIRKLEALLKLA